MWVLLTERVLILKRTVLEGVLWVEELIEEIRKPVLKSISKRIIWELVVVYRTREAILIGERVLSVVVPKSCEIEK
jgi:hypothetical protein